jgi:CubicO group peptidase (beta-lactamase class C family)
MKIRKLFSFLAVLALAVAAVPGDCLAAARTGAAAVPVVQADLPSGDWQVDVTFPDWSGKQIAALAQNSMYSFTGYTGQGELYITPSAGVTSFTLFVNNREVDTSLMTAGATWKVDISGIAKNGTNTVQLSNIEPSENGITVNMKAPYPVVIAGTPESVGISKDSLSMIDAIIQSDVDHGFPGAQLAVIKDGKMVFSKAWGHLDAYNPDNTAKTDSPLSTTDTLYDLASNTKMYSVAYAIQYLVTQGKIRVDDPIMAYIGPKFSEDTIDIHYSGHDDPGLATQKQWKASLTIRDVMSHEAGFPPDPQYNRDKYDQTGHGDKNAVNVLYCGANGVGDARADTLESICKTPLLFKPRSKSLYSDVDYMLLCFVIEKVTGERLDAFLRETFWNPMGLTRITYCPLQSGYTMNDCAAEELNGNTRGGIVSFPGIRTATIQGEVHDEEAFYCMGGVSGHAGLFSSAEDLSKLASVMITGGYGSYRFFSRNVIDLFISPVSSDIANMGTGWWREGGNMETVRYFGTDSPSDTVGHQGWTGTMTMIDRKDNLVIVLLTNKINSPVTDINVNPDMFDGNWYTTASLGFVSQILYQGINAGTDPKAADTALLKDMINEKKKAAAQAVTSGYTVTENTAIMKSVESLEAVLAARQ